MKKMNRIFCKFSLAVMITSMCASVIIPVALHARGYFTIGGEWLILLVVFIAVYVLIM